MADKVFPSPDRDTTSKVLGQLMQYAGGSDPGWVVPDGYAKMAESARDGFSQTSSSGSLDVTISTGEAFVNGSWVDRDSTTTVTLSASTANQKVYAGFDLSMKNTAIVGLSDDFVTDDPKMLVWTFDTDGSGVTGYTDCRNFYSPGRMQSLIKKQQQKLSRRQTGIIIPLYVYPTTGTHFEDIIDYAKDYHNVPVYVVINPSSGPGSSTDSNYTTAINQLHGAGITVLGYIATDYTNDSLSTVKAEVDTWVDLYPEIDGIMFDEMDEDDTDANISYYKQLTYYIHEKGLWPSVGLPGTSVPESYYENETADIILYWEGSSYLSESVLKEGYEGTGNNDEVDYNKRGNLIYNQSSFSASELILMAKYLGLVYVTDDNTPNPWDTLSSHIENIFAVLDAAYTIDDTSNNESDTDSLQEILNSMGNVLKSITGKDDWYDTAAVDIDTIDSDGDGKVDEADNADKLDNVQLADIDWSDVAMSKTDVSKSDVGLGDVENKTWVEIGSGTETVASGAQSYIAGAIPDSFTNPMQYLVKSNSSTDDVIQGYAEGNSDGNSWAYVFHNKILFDDNRWSLNIKNNEGEQNDYDWYIWEWK